MQRVDEGLAQRGDAGSGQHEDIIKRLYARNMAVRASTHKYSLVRPLFLSLSFSLSLSLSFPLSFHLSPFLSVSHSVSLFMSLYLN